MVYPLFKNKDTL